VPVEVNDPELPAIQIFGDSPHRRKPERMVAAEHHGEGPAGIDVRDTFADLMEWLFNVGRDG
jgi:hypothetical protein